LVGKYHRGTHERPGPGFDDRAPFRGGRTTGFLDAAIFDSGRHDNLADAGKHADPEFDSWQGGTGKALPCYGKRRTDR
jgi:hypothetical protein